MFIESNFGNPSRGSIEVICGSMFSGKTEELIRRIKRAALANQKIQIFKPKMDTRYDESDVVSHNNSRIESVPVEKSMDILLHLSQVNVVGIDEAQFFDNDVVEVATTLAQKGIRVIVAGLDMDFLGAPFGAMPQLLAIAEEVTKLHAICMKCGQIANFSYRKSDENTLFLLGETQEYEARCRACFNAS